MRLPSGKPDAPAQEGKELVAAAADFEPAIPGSGNLQQSFS
jgi:hypothetical protein